MATEKKITSRIQQKHDVAANWAKATNFIPKKGEIIIYDAEYNASGEETQAVRFKIGDGSKTVNNLPFAVIDYSSDIETLEQEVANNSNEISKIKDGPTQVASAKISESAFLLLNSLKIIGRSVVGAGDNVDEYNGRLPIIIRFDEDSFIKSVNSVGSSVIELRNTGVKSGTYNNVTVDSKGRVTAGESKDYLTSHQSIKSINTNNTTAQAVNASETIAGSGTINLHKVAKTGSYNDLSNKPTIPTVNNGKLTIQKNGTDVATFTANQSTNVTANITVPTKVSEITNDSGYTTNKGTVTSVAVKMNGSEKGKVTSSGTIDLGTVLTNASAFATSAQGKKADNAMPKSGGTFTGNVSLPKELVFTDNTNPFIKMTTGGTDFYFQSTSGQFGLGPTWNKATHWDSNGNVTFPTTPKVGSSPLALKSDIPDVSGKANLNGGNTFSGAQTFKDFIEFVDSNGDGVLSLGNNAIFVDPEGRGLIPVSFSGDFGLSGQVLTSQGGNTTPIWATPAIKSATLTGTTLYLTL